MFLKHSFVELNNLRKNIEANYRRKLRQMLLEFFFAVGVNQKGDFL